MIFIQLFHHINLFHLQLDWNYCFSRSLKFLQCWFSVFFCFFDPFFKSILLLLELLTTVLLDLISIFAESLSMVLRWQSDSQSGLKNPLTVHLMVHFIRPFQATSSSIGWFKYVCPFRLPALSFRISSITIFLNFQISWKLNKVILWNHIESMLISNVSNLDTVDFKWMLINV